MILSFGAKETEKAWKGERVKKWSLDMQIVARKKLRMLNNAQNLSDLKIPPSNMLDKLSGNLRDYYSIRINSQWRIIFRWTNGNGTEVRVLDYHQ